jgi:magnesium-transporting ATPase (P-type)
VCCVALLRMCAVVLMVAILDPPREEAVEAIKVAHKAGISVKMITGQSAPTGSVRTAGCCCMACDGVLLCR